MECNICHKNISVSIHYILYAHIRKAHLDKLKNTQETLNIVDSSERVLSFETDTMLKDRYIEMCNFWIHMKKIHKQMFNLEVKLKSLYGSSRI